MKWHQAPTEKFYRVNVGGPSKCQNIHDSFRLWLGQVSSIKFLIGYHLMYASYHNVISDYNYTEYYIIILTKYNLMILIES